MQYSSALMDDFVAVQSLSGRADTYKVMFTDQAKIVGFKPTDKKVWVRINEKHEPFFKAPLWIPA